MEKEYIERGALLEELQEEIDFESAMYTEEQNKWLRAGLSIAARDVRKQPTADVVPRDEVEMHGASYYFKLEQAIESSQRFMAEHDAALAKKIFGEIELFLNKAIDGWRKERKFAYSDRQIEMIDFRNGAFKYCLHEIAELKEKYTKGGEQNERT